MLKQLDAAYLFDAELGLIGGVWILNCRIIASSDSLSIHRASLSSIDSPFGFYRNLQPKIDSLLQCIHAFKPTSINDSAGDNAVFIKGGTLTKTNGGTKHVKPFFIDATEVTIREYTECLEAGICSGLHDEPKFPEVFSPWHFDYPMHHVSWIEALTYCEWKGKRLPTPSEWEFACVSGRKNQSSIENSEWLAEDARGTIHPVAGKKPNSLGLYDMLGNVWEWTADPDSVKNSRTVKFRYQSAKFDWGYGHFDPHGSDVQTPMKEAGCFSRGNLLYDNRDRISGFRCARSVKEAP